MKINKKNILFGFLLFCINFVIISQLFDYYSAKNYVYQFVFVESVADNRLDINLDEIHKPDKTKVKSILLLTNYFGKRGWELPRVTNGYEYFTTSENCEFANCVITSNISYYDDISKYDAVVFHVTHAYRNLISHPIPRSYDQVYVAANMESPVNTDNPLRSLEYFFNWTMTYRMDSDVLWNYGDIVDLHTNQVVAPAHNPNWREIDFKNLQDKKMIEIVKNKRKSVAWFVSDCKTQSKREILVKNLQQYLDIDIYGRCGTKSCPYRHQKCNNMLTKDYKFYLSFENSLCKDYVTEKLFNILDQYVIPVVYGGADYRKFAPPHSYINANDFQSPEHLAKYLLYLTENQEEYLKYFWWKSHYKVVSKIRYCNLCKALHQSKEKKIMYADIKSWWYSNDECTNARKIKF
uniref:Fucosyltransferase n=1 Tax=Corethrella appendiculata TaxID=1370023 RepID=U5EV02_9DIPT